MISSSCFNKCVAIIPAFDEGNTIYSVVSGVKQYIPNVIVIDDGSSDNTTAYAEKAGATVLRHNINRGKGAALKTGFKYALMNGTDLVIVLDGDGQHNPSDLAIFMKALYKTDADIIIGDRLRDNGNMPLGRKLTNSASSGLISLLLGKRLIDVHCGYRCIRANVLKDIILECDKFDIDIELIIKAVKQGFTLKEINIETIYCNGNSKIKPFGDTIRYFRTLIKENILGGKF